MGVLSVSQGELAAQVLPEAGHSRDQGHQFLIHSLLDLFPLVTDSIFLYRGISVTTCNNIWGVRVR